MSDEVIKRALGEATVAACNAVEGCPRNGICHDAGQCQHETAMEYNAAAIAAFLGALPKYDNEGDAILYDAELLSAAIERAGRRSEWKVTMTEVKKENN